MSKGFISVFFSGLILAALLLLLLGIFSINNTEDTSLLSYKSKLIAQREADALEFFNSTLDDLIFDAAYAAARGDATGCRVGNLEEFCGKINSLESNKKYFAASALALGASFSLVRSQISCDGSTPNAPIVVVELDYSFDYTGLTFSRSGVLLPEKNVVLKEPTVADKNLVVTISDSLGNPVRVMSILCS
ncbi:MAG: hypothetical protein ABH803_00495 [Candidatus Micrarchaeota archaeon]